MILIKRVYVEPSGNDGYRILVDRLWPRGINKEKASIDLWLKEIAPSTELRTWFSHDPEKWPVFKKKYLLELKEKTNELNEIRERGKKGNVTLLFGAKDEKHNNAVVLLEYLGKLK